VLRILSEGMGVGVRENVDAMVQIDCAKLAARVAWQPRVAGRMNVAGAYALACLEASQYLYVSVRRVAFRELTRNGTRNKRGSGPRRARRRLTALNFRASDQPAFNHFLDERV